MRLLMAAIFVALCSIPAFAQEQERTYTLTVTQQQLGVIGDALSELPYKTANPLIRQLSAQVQLQNMQGAPKPADAPKPDQPGAGQ